MLGRGIEHGQEPAHDEIVELGLDLVQAAWARTSVGMIAKWSEILALSKMRLLGSHPLLLEDLAREAAVARWTRPSSSSVAFTVPR